MIRCFNLETSEVTRVAQVRERNVSDIHVSNGLSRLAVGYRSGGVDLIDLDSGEIEWSRSGRRAEAGEQFKVAMSEDGRYVARTSSDGNLIIWRTDQHPPVFRKQYSGFGRAVMFSADGKLLAHANDSVQIFRSSTNELLYEFGGGNPHAISFRDDGRYLASCYIDGGLRLFDLAASEESVIRLDGTELRSIAFDQNGQTVLAAGVGTIAKGIYFSEVETGETYGFVDNPLAVDSGDAPSVCKIFVTDGRLILCNVHLPDPTIAVWDLTP